MGKKKGQQQRTKGNVLPSSSVRSADLLTREGSNTGLGLFQTLPSAGLGNIPELAGLDSITNTQFRTVLKKLYKRDVTTKLKALGEFGELCKSCKLHEVLTVLPYWPRVYNRLFEDNDRRVRENAQKAMHAVIIAIGKNLALQLKNIMGCWFISQCDPYAPSALATETSIAQAFTGEKKIEAFVFCRKEILKCITSYLFGPQSKREKMSEQEGSNYHRIMASSLEAFSLYIQTVSKHKPLSDELEEILNDSKFWKFQKHSNPPVRGGFYSGIESLCIEAPDLLKLHLSEASKSIFHRLDESNIAVCKPLYAAAVAIVATCDTWHETVDIQKGVIPGLCSILKSGCHGLGAYVLPSLLPILAKIPNSVGLLAIYSKIFEAMRICLDHDQVKLSKRGCEQAIITYVELLRLCVIRLSQETPDCTTNEEISQVIMEENIRHLLSESFGGKSGKYSNEFLYKLICGSIHSWTSKKFQNDLFAKLCDDFWEKINAVVHDYSLKEENYTASKLIIQFLCEVVQLQPSLEMATQRHSVKFVRDDSSQDLSPSGTVTESLKLPSEVFSVMQDNVNKIVMENILSTTLRESLQKLSIYKICFQKLVSPEFFELICRKNFPTVSHDDGVGQYVEEILIPEAKRVLGVGVPDHDLVETLSDIIYYALLHSENSKSFPFDIVALLEYDTSDPKFVLALCFLSNLAKNAHRDPKIEFWMVDLLKESHTMIWKFLGAITDSISLCDCDSKHGTNSHLDRSWGLLNNIFTSFMNVDGCMKCLCDTEGILRISKKISENLDMTRTCSVCYAMKLEKFSVLMLACITRDSDNSAIASLVTGDGEPFWGKLMTDLLTTYFSVEISDSKLLHCFSEFFNLAAKNVLPFINEYSVDIHEYLRKQADWMKCKLMDECKDTAAVVSKVNSLSDVIQEVVSFLNNLLPEIQEWEKIRGFSTNLPFLEEIMPDLSVDGSAMVDKLANDCSPEYLDLVHIFEKVTSHIVTMLQENNTIVAWEEQEKILFLAEESAVASVIEKFSAFESFLNGFSAEFRVTFWSKVLEKSSKIGGIWPYCVHSHASQFGGNEFDALYDQFFKACKEDRGLALPLFQTMSVIVHFVSEDKLDEIVSELSNQILLMPAEDVWKFGIYLFSLGVLAITKMGCERRFEFVKSFFKLTVDWRSEKDDLFLFDDNFANATKDLLLLNLSMAELFLLTVQIRAETLTECQWDLIRCSLVSWMESASNFIGKSDENQILVTRLLKSSCALLREIKGFMSSPTAMNDPTVPTNLVSEWSGFFSLSTYTSLVKSFTEISNVKTPFSVVFEVCRCVQEAPEKSILGSAANLKPKLSPDSSLPNEIQTIMNHLCPLLCPSTKSSSEKHPISVLATAYKLIHTILERLVDADTSAPPDIIFNVIKTLSTEIEPLFVCHDVEIPKAAPDSEDSEGEDDVEEIAGDLFKENILTNITPILGYLLTWKLLLNLAKFITPEKKPGYIDSLVKRGSHNLTNTLLPKLYKLMVGKISHFKTDIDMNFENGVKLDDVEHIAASLYQDFLIQMPAASRAWFNDLPKAVRSRVDKFTSTYVSPVLIEREFKAVQVTKQQQAVEGMDIVARPAAREVHATYKLNEVQMEIAVCLSPNHPLGPITVNTEKRAGVVMGQWRYWILQITTFLQYQNGGIIDGLLLWKYKVDKRFEGLEDCMICFSLVHGNSQSLPKLKCKTCKKKYHAECLYKWFDTSNNSTCPICRSPMIFR